MARSKERPSFPGKVVKGRIEPVDAFGADMISAYEGKEINIEIYRRKNPRQLGAYWSLMSKIVEATDIAPDRETLSKMLLDATGYVERWRTFNGEEVTDPQSIADMDEERFSIYYTKALDFIHQRILPGCNRKLLGEGKIVMEEDVDAGSDHSASSRKPRRQRRSSDG